MATLREASEGYIQLRNQKKALAAEHKEQMAPFNEKMKKLEAYMLDKMGQEGLQNIATETATVYKSTRSSTKVQDWPIFLQWLQENEAWDFIAHRAADANVKEYLEEKGHLPPGLSISTEQTLGVRVK